MTIGRSATPLIGLDAVVLDTETTGLDPRNARIVEIAALRLVGGRLEAGAPLRKLVHPGGPIPASATRIHGIDDAAVAKAPTFADVWADVSAYLGDAVLIGHAIGYDRTVIARECERAGKSWQAPITLDTQMLAQVAQADLPEYSLESLAAWLGVEIANRHSALGDATAAGQIFCALVPRLRGCGIRTLAEALRACRGLSDAHNWQRRTGWDTAAASQGIPVVRQLDEHVDTYPYRKRVGAIMTSPAKAIVADAALEAAIERLVRERTSSLFVVPAKDMGSPLAESTGIITERDVLRALEAYGAEALALPVRQFTSKPLQAVPASAFAYLAIGRMNRLRVRHLGVIDDARHVVGAVSARDLLRLRTEDAVELGDRINQANDVHELSRAWATLAQVSAELLYEGLPAREIAAVISHELCQLTHQAAVLAERVMNDAGLGGPPCRYAFAVLGSGGRGESLLAMDQDNALIFEDDAPEGADRWFETLSIQVADTLHQIGVPYCKGGVMAKNSRWRGSLGAWRKQIGDWIQVSDPQALLSVDIFFDLRGVHGEVGLADTLWREAFDTAQGNIGFAKLLLESAGPVSVGRNWFGGFRTVEGRINLKASGLFGLVSIARVLAIRHNVIERSTPARLAGVKTVVQRSDTDLDALIDAQETFLALILTQQIVDLKSGRPPSDAVEVKSLSPRDRQRLGTALQAVENIGELARDILFET